MNEIVTAALGAGFTDAVWLDGLAIECEPRLRAYCNPQDCPNHGSNWVCPPGCGSLEECAARVGKFDKGVLLRSVSGIDPQAADYKGLSREHNLRLRRFIETVEGRELMALTSGGCIFCETCAYPEPCVKPGVRMNSLSAHGIDVGKLCANAGLEYSFRPDKVYYTALVLMK